MTMNAASSSSLTIVHTPCPALAYGTFTTAMPPMRFTHSGICARTRCKVSLQEVRQQSLQFVRAGEACRSCTLPHVEPLLKYNMKDCLVGYDCAPSFEVQMSSHAPQVFPGHASASGTFHIVSGVLIVSPVPCSSALCRSYALAASICAAHRPSDDRHTQR